MNYSEVCSSSEVERLMGELGSMCGDQGLEVPNKFQPRICFFFIQTIWLLYICGELDKSIKSGVVRDCV